MGIQLFDICFCYLIQHQLIGMNRFDYISQIGMHLNGNFIVIQCPIGADVC